MKTVEVHIIWCDSCGSPATWEYKGYDDLLIYMCNRHHTVEDARSNKLDMTTVTIE